jgi:hypothetical protein
MLGAIQYISSQTKEFLSKCQRQDSYMSNLIMWICMWQGRYKSIWEISSVLMLILMLESIMLLESSNDLSK